MRLKWRFIERLWGQQEREREKWKAEGNTDGVPTNYSIYLLLSGKQNKPKIT